MPSLSREINPFALMLDPQGVLAQIEHSERLERLARRVCRPLDKPLLGASAGADEGDDSTDEDGLRQADEGDAPPADAGWPGRA